MQRRLYTSFALLLLFSLFSTWVGAAPRSQPTLNTLMAQSTEFVVADFGWQQTALTVQSGEQFTVSYTTGTWTVDYRTLAYIGPEGYSSSADALIPASCKEVASLPYARLLGRIGTGAVFSVGQGGTFTANATGSLYLRINDQDACLGDNAGEVEMVVGTSSGVVDLEVTSIQASASPICAGSDADFQAYIQNNGSSASGFFNIRWSVDGQIFDGGHVSIAPGASDTHPHLWLNISQGQHTLTFVADFDNGILETNENNNQRTITFSAVNCTPTAPVANFTATPRTGNAPLNVTFTNSSTGNITNCSWNYGDGTTGTSCAASHTHTYTNAGTYTVNLTVTGPGGSNTKTQTNYITLTAPGNCKTSSGTWQNTAIAPQTGTFMAEFDATPNQANMDGVIGFSNAAAAAYADLAAIARFYTNGLIDARDGGVYRAVSQIPYTAGTQYHFRFVVRVPSHTYDIFVTPKGGTEQVVGTNFAFRSEQSSVTSLGNWALYRTSGSHSVCNVTIIPQTTQPPVADFTATPQSGNAPLTVQFTDTSTGNPSNWAWDFDNNGTTDSNARNPRYTYDSSGTYSVKLTITGTSGSDMELKNNFITVSTDPCGDMDGDGLCDNWELYGIDGLDLPAMGAKPNHKDIFVEIDFMVDPGTCILGICTGHSHKPEQEAIEMIIEAFKDAPVSNPDNIHGINLHIDAGSGSIMNFVQGSSVKWGNLSRSNSLTHDDDISWDEFYAFKNNLNNFEPARKQIFHYAIFAHFLDGNRCRSGEAPMPGMDLIVTLGGWNNPIGGQCDAPAWRWYVGSAPQQAGTFMHELGHNLGLDHGGGDGINHKPNYLSVMNYLFQTRGLTISGKDGVFDYSRSDKIPPLDETHLNERVGLNGGSSTTNYGTRWFCNDTDNWTDSANGPINWNCVGSDDEVDIHTDVNNGPEETLFNYFDWAMIDYRGGDNTGQSLSHATQINSTFPKEMTSVEDNRLFSAYRVSVSVPGEVQAPQGITIIHRFTISNLGRNSDIYTLNASSSQGWADLRSLPANVNLAPGESSTILIEVTIPRNAGNGVMDELKLVIRSQDNSRIFDVATARTRIRTVIYLPLVRR